LTGPAGKVFYDYDTGRLNLLDEFNVESFV